MPSLESKVEALLEALAHPDAVVVNVKYIKDRVEEIVMLKNGQSSAVPDLARSMDESIMEAFGLCCGLCLSPQCTTSVQEVLFPCAMSLYVAFDLQSQFSVIEILQVLLKVACGLCNALLASECLTAAREAVAQAGHKITEEEQQELKAKVLVESYRVALRLESKALQTNVTTELVYLLAGAQPCLAQAALDACELSLSKVVEMLEAGDQGQDAMHLGVLRSALSILHATQPIPGLVQQLRDMHAQVLLLYIPSSIQAGLCKEALARSAAFLEASPRSSKDWWNVWLLTLHARIASKEHVHAAREVCKSLGSGEDVDGGGGHAEECPPEVLSNALSLLARTLPSLATADEQGSQTAHACASLLISTAARAAAHHGACMAEPILALAEHLLSGSSSDGGGCGHSGTGASGERLVLKLLADKEVVKVLLQAKEEQRARCCSAIYLCASQLYQAREFERARALCSATLLYAPLYHFGHALKSVAFCDLKLQRYKDALANLEQAERQAAGLGAVCKLMQMRACFGMQDWEGANRHIHEVLHCADFRCSHLQVAYAEAMAAAQGPAAAGAAECAVSSLQLLKGCYTSASFHGPRQADTAGQDSGQQLPGPANGPSPGRVCSQMLAALALLRPTAESAPERKAWVHRVLAELEWACSFVAQARVRALMQGDEHRALPSCLLQACFDVGQQCLAWRCWDAAVTAMDLAGTLCLALPAVDAQGCAHSSEHKESLQLALAIAKLHALLQKQQQGNQVDAEAVVQGCQRICSVTASLQEHLAPSPELVQTMHLVQMEATACAGAQRCGLCLSDTFQTFAEASPPPRVLAHVARLCLSALKLDSSVCEPEFVSTLEKVQAFI